MDKYHIYEEIGKGDFSQVFKGREKKKIEYVAIKRTDKSVMNKVSRAADFVYQSSSNRFFRLLVKCKLCTN